MAINHITRDETVMFREECKMRFAGFRNATNAMDYFQELATQNANWPGRATALGLIYVAGKLAGEAGELVQQPFKAMRDDGFCTPINDPDTREFLGFVDEIAPERRAKIIKEAGGLLWYLAALATELGMNLSDIALANLEQLADRTERGTLQGDGDER